MQLMRIRLKDDMIARRFRFTEPSSGYEIWARSIPKLTAKVAKHRAANGIPLGEDLEAEVQEQICLNNPHWCEEINENNEAMPGFGFQLANLGKAMVRWAKAGFPMVTEEVLRERIAICEACPHIKRWQEFGIARCGLCGCATGKKINLKLQMATEKCPDKPPRWQ